MFSLVQCISHFPEFQPTNGNFPVPVASLSSKMSTSFPSGSKKEPSLCDPSFIDLHFITDVEAQQHFLGNISDEKCEELVSETESEEEKKIRRKKLGELKHASINRLINQFY